MSAPAAEKTPSGGRHSAGMRVTWRYVYYLRFPIFTWIALPALCLMQALGTAEGMTHGLFVLESPRQFFFCGFVASLLCFVAIGRARLVFSYGCERFDSPPPRRRIASGLTWPIVAIAHVPAAIFIAFVVNAADEGSLALSALAGIIGWAVGFAVVLLVTLGYNWFHPNDSAYHEIFVPVRPGTLLDKALLRPSPKTGWAQRLSIRIARLLGPGYTRQGSGDLHSGHALAIWLVLVLWALYFIVGIATKPSGNVSVGTWFPVIAVVVSLAIFYGWLLSAVSFFFDRWNAPVILTVVAIGVLFGIFFPAEHYYKLADIAHPQSVPWATPPEVLSQWESDHPDPATPMVIITAEGGGIQASAWTAKVLTELDGLSGGKLRGSVLLVSSVSGGSVAAMDFANSYFVNESNREATTGTYTGELKDPNCLVDLASASSLEAVAWGILYPDTFRSLTSPFGTLRFGDRGDSLQRRWRLLRESRTDCTPLRKNSLLGLSDWAAGLRAGIVPAIALNATATETGQRFLLSNFDMQSLPADKLPCRRGTFDPNAKSWTLTFHELFPGCDVDVTTAARLSASFTYVSPQPRSSLETPRHMAGGPEALHLADGGYYDNYGILTAIDFLNAAIAQPAPTQPDPALPARRRTLLFIQILCCEEPTPYRAVQDAHLKTRGGFFQLVAPLDTLMSVRTSGQWQAAQQELQLFQNRIQQRYDFVPVIIPFVPATPGGMASSEVIPLSWHLTQREKDRLDSQWQGFGDAARSRYLCTVLNAFQPGSVPAQCPAQ